MDTNKANIMDSRELAAELAKLPESVQLKILYMIEGAQLVSDAQKAG
jgi:hypothetical protein